MATLQVHLRQAEIIFVTLLLASQVQAARLTLVWTDNSNNECGFILERQNPEQANWQPVAWIDANRRTYDDVGLTDGQRYRYRLAAFNAAGQSTYSNETTGVATQPDPVPSNTTVPLPVTTPCFHIDYRP